MTIDDVDAAILRALVEDGRMPVAEVGRRANVSRASAYSRIDRLSRDGIILGYAARVSPRRMGLEISALVFLQVEQGRWRAVKDHLLELREVEFVGLTSGDFDFVLLVRATSTDNLRDVVLARLLALKEVRSTRTVLLFDDEMRRPVIPGPVLPG